MLERAATVSNISMGTVSISLVDKVAGELEREKEREEAASKIAAVRKGQVARRSVERSSTGTLAAMHTFATAESEREREEAASKIAAMRKGQALLQPLPLVRPLTPPTHLRPPLLYPDGTAAARPQRLRL